MMFVLGFLLFMAMFFYGKGLPIADPFPDWFLVISGIGLGLMAVSLLIFAWQKLP